MFEIVVNLYVLMTDFWVSNTEALIKLNNDLCLEHQYAKIYSFNDRFERISVVLTVSLQIEALKSLTVQSRKKFPLS